MAFGQDTNKRLGNDDAFPPENMRLRNPLNSVSLQKETEKTPSLLSTPLYIFSNILAEFTNASNIVVAIKSF